MRRSWSVSLKFLAFAALLANRFYLCEPVIWAAAAIAVVALSLDLLDWRAGLRPAPLRFVSGVALLVAAGVLIGFTRTAAGTDRASGLPTVVEVPEYGFRLNSPGPGWALLAKADLPSPPHQADIQAGADFSDGIEDAIYVVPLERWGFDPAGEPNLDALASIYKSTIVTLWSDTRELEYRRLLFADRDARQFQIRGVDGGGQRRTALATLFTRDRWIYILAVIGLEERCRPDDARFKAFTNSFEWIPATPAAP